MVVQANADVTATTFLGRTPLHLAAYGGHRDAVKALLGKGADVNQTDPKLGRSALHWAASYGHAKVVKTLIQSGADVAMVDAKSGMTALHLAIRHGHAACTEVSQSVFLFLGESTSSSGNKRTDFEPKGTRFRVALDAPCLRGWYLQHPVGDGASSLSGSAPSHFMVHTSRLVRCPQNSDGGFRDNCRFFSRSGNLPGVRTPRSRCCGRADMGSLSAQPPFSPTEPTPTCLTRKWEAPCI